MMTNGRLVEEVRAVQASMQESARSQLSESELDDLRCLIRLTVEFSHYLEDEDGRPPDPSKTRYVGESIFSGVDSFSAITAAVRGMFGSTKSALPSDVTSVESLKQEFDKRYRDFLVEANFDHRCRLLLDLFKLQIVFAGLSYE
jgi:hypothetical protein